MPPDLAPSIARLNGLGIGAYREVVSESKVRAISRLGPGVFVHQFMSENRSMALWAIRDVGSSVAEVLVAGVHLPAKLGGKTDADQIVAATSIINDLCGEEDRRGHRNTAIVGDFNMNPYDQSMTSVAGIHGLMTRDLARKSDRIHEKKAYRRFYNPMWGLFGDRTPGPAGSYFWRSSGALHNPHWSMPDQVLLRPNLIDRLSGLGILDHDGQHPLVRLDGTPDHENYSDHLPLSFSLDL